MAQANGYGTLSGERRAENGMLDGADGERAALLGKSEHRGSLAQRAQRYMTVDVRKTGGDVMLLGCYIITGLLDSSSVQVWGSFVSMQTGNTVYFGLGLAAPRESTRWIRAGISVGCFALGSFFFARYHRFLGPRKRWVMVFAYLLQLIMMVGAALMITFGPPINKEGPVDIWTGLPIALIAFQSAGQAVTSRVLGYSGLTSVVLTSIYCDLFSDPKLFTLSLWDNPERLRRASAAICVALGACFGGLWAHSEAGFSGALWTAVCLKTLVALGWLFWWAEKDSQ